MTHRNDEFNSYAIYKCSALVEMQTSSITHDGEEKDDGFEHVSEVRPNIYVNKMDERELFVVRKWQELNQMDQYDLITEAPRIEVEFETKAMYCPKYTVSFYMVSREMEQGGGEEERVRVCVRVRVRVHA